MVVRPRPRRRRLLLVFAPPAPPLIALHIACRLTAVTIVVASPSDEFDVDVLRLLLLLHISPLAGQTTEETSDTDHRHYKLTSHVIWRENDDSII